MGVTIKDVAKKANVSVATISRILNDLGGYTEETRERVLKVIEELEYQPNAIARGLITKNTNTIAVLVPNVSTIYYAEILSGLEDMAHKNNYSVIICNTGIDGSRTLDYLKMFASRQIDGIVIISLPITDEYCKVLKTIKSPCALISTISYRYQLPYVKVDDKQAAYSATQYLIDKGHKNIAMISGTAEDAIAGAPRIQGYMQALEDNAIAVNKKLIKCGNFSYRSGIKCMEELLGENEAFTAVFAASDDMAVGVLSVAHNKGIRVPEDLSVVGYDNTLVAEMAIPPLTVVAQPLYDMGKKSIEILLNMIKKERTGIESIIMSHRIVERNTVKEFK